MSNRYRMTAKEAAVARACGFEPAYAPDKTYPPPAEIFPKRLGLVVREQDGTRFFDRMIWGFPRTFTGASGKRIVTQVVNVRDFASPFWRSALKNPERRCLVPFTSFSEYGKGAIGNMPLYWFNLPSRPIACFAGVWRPAEAEPVFALLTTEPNAVVAPIHPKAMPVILHPEDYDRWLRASVEDALKLATPYTTQLMSVDEPENEARKSAPAE
jgi:putative SOS response-associated peptidase YedK